MSAFRESSVIVIETTKRAVRAGVGLGEFLRAPTIVCLFHFLDALNVVDCFVGGTSARRFTQECLNV